LRAATKSGYKTPTDAGKHVRSKATADGRGLLRYGVVKPPDFSPGGIVQSLLVSVLAGR
jgi:hypothetical protein